MNSELTYTVTDFVAICNQVLDTSFGSVQITGELTNFKISKNRWVYFDLKDDYSSLRFFGTVYQLPGPLTDGMMLTVRGAPQLHPKFGFSITVQSIQLSGEGTIKKAAQILEQKLEKEGLFDTSRKRQLPFPPAHIGIVSSAESAGYADFVKIMNERWSGLTASLIDVQVQGEKAPAQIMEAIQYFNQHSPDIEALVIIRGGGSADDLQAFNHELVTRAIAASRIPTLVAIGHETDITLSEKVADLRASTPSNAAQLLLPDKASELEKLAKDKAALTHLVEQTIVAHKAELGNVQTGIYKDTKLVVENLRRELGFIKKNLQSLNPNMILKRGFVIVRQNGSLISRIASLNIEKNLELQFEDGLVEAKPIKSGKL